MAGSRSRSAASFSPRWQQRLRRYNWRPVAWLAAGSLVFSLALIGYLYGADSHFFGRLFSAFVVIFGLLSFTFLAAVPFVTWAAANWFGRSWAGAPAPVSRPPRASAGPSAGIPTPSRRPNVPARNPESYP